MQEHLQEMIRKITRFSIIIVPVAALAALFFGDWFFVLNLLIGGAISLLSFRAIVWAVRKFMSMQMAQSAIMGISVIKIGAIGLFLIGLALLQLIRPVPLLAGFTLVLVIIIVQGLLTAGKVS
jgi:hypothetical protein